MADLLIHRDSPGVAVVRSTDTYDTFRIYRIDRGRWRETPETPGVYLLYGVAHEGKLTVYIGKSSTSMRARIGDHHVNPNKNWFGVLFAVPTDSLLCTAIEAELIGLVIDADVVDVIDNRAEESRYRGVDVVHVEPVVEKICLWLELVLGSDIFTAADTAQPEQLDPPVARAARYAREYHGPAEGFHERSPEDPSGATHVYAGFGRRAWGSFEGEEPDNRFRVLSGSTWRATTLDNPEAKTYEAQVRVSKLQQELIDSGVLDEATQAFAKDHVFENWTTASQVVSGKSNYSGSWRWQRLTDQPPAVE